MMIGYTMVFNRDIALFICTSVYLFCNCLTYSNEQHTASPPYPKSGIIQNVQFDFSTHQRMAEGSDNFPVTWAGDGHIYAAWGDGGGFGGTNSLGRVKLGVARIEGTGNDYKGINVWGGIDAEAPAEFEGKSYGILSVDGTLYMWVAPQPNPHLHECRIASSTDFAMHWSLADWAFIENDQLSIPTFLNFGKDYENSRDSYVYSYYIHPMWGPSEAKDTPYGFDVHKPGKIYLSRTPKKAVLDQAKYEFFIGFDAEHSPQWSQDRSLKQPVFEDPNGVGWNLSVSYNPGLKRYILCTEHTETHAGKFGMFDAQEPWGPWTTVVYDDGFGKGAIEVSAFYWNFCTKWLSGDGRRFTLIFSGKNSNDSWNTVEGEFALYLVK